MDKIRKMAEKNNFEGFFIYHSTGGGTTGLLNLINENLSNEYSKKLRCPISIYP